MKLSEMNKNPMKPKCECGKTFTSPSNLRRHKNTTVSCPIYGSQKETKLGGRLGKSVPSLKKWMKKGASKLKGLLNVEVTININNNNVNI